jgi:hypothetical protein
LTIDKIFAERRPEAPKGVSGNPAGRPRRPETIANKKIEATVKALAREGTPEAIDGLAKIMRGRRRAPQSAISGDNRVA